VAELLPKGRRLRVLILIDRLGVVGGGEGFARQLALNLDPQRFERIYCVSRWSEEEASTPDARLILDELERAGVEVIGLRRRSRFDLLAWRPLLRALRKGRVDVLHTHKIGSNIWGAIWGTLARTPVVVAHEQTWSFEGNPARKFVDRHLISRRADAFLCVSSEDRRRMIEIERIDPQKIHFVPNAVPIRAPTPGRDLRSELGVSPQKTVVGSVCVLRDQKALDVLIRAVGLLASSFPNLLTLIVGDGPERARLEALIAELGLGDRVSMLGQRTDVPDLLAAFDIAASSSDFEGTPLAVIEYMGAGLPVVATRVGGVPDLVDDGVEGRLVPRRDPAAFAEALAGLLTDPRAAVAMGERGRERQRAEFDVRVAADRIGSLYESLFAASSSRNVP
jgi:glycosyltransferase involved in cell wall biosynthesis